MISDLINKIKMKVGPLDQLTSKSDPINRGEIIKIIKKKQNKETKQNVHHQADTPPSCHRILHDGRQTPIEKAERYLRSDRS